MAGKASLLSDLVGPRRLGNACTEGEEIEMPQGSFDWVLEYIRRVPDIRPDKVSEIRRRIASGSWDPNSTRVAEKILYEHLFDPEPN